MKILNINKFRSFFYLLAIVCFTGCNQGKPVYDAYIINPYVDKFNQHDEELYVQYIPDSSAITFMRDNIPLFECPDKDMEEIYYFRWWTYRKHIKKTPEGFIITEFLPDVSWAGKYNGICCPAMLHYNEGRWLHNHTFLNDYAYYWLRGGGNLRSYSFPVAYSLYNYYLVTGNDSIIKELLPDLIQNYEGWEKDRWDDKKGLFWQTDNRDGMEISIGGNGYRATINSYMTAEAKVIATIAGLTQNPQKEIFEKKSETLQTTMLKTLWDEKAEFFKVLSREEGSTVCDARELHGYTPWAFDLAGPEYAGAWKFLMDTTHFHAPYGLTTAERCHPGFQISYEGHECQWNGPSWPLSTSITLTGLANLLNNQKQENITKADYFKLLKIFAKSQHRTKEDGTVIPWIDENLNPFTGEWIARTRLKEMGWKPANGGRERGKDYNHSSFCDLIISGLVGIRPQEGNTLVVNPLVPEGVWDYFCLDNVSYHGKILTILYDKTGEKYKKGKGLIIFVDGKKVTTSPQLSTIECKL